MLIKNVRDSDGQWSHIIVDKETKEDLHIEADCWFNKINWLYKPKDTTLPKYAFIVIYTSYGEPTPEDLTEYRKRLKEIEG